MSLQDSPNLLDVFVRILHWLLSISGIIGILSLLVIGMSYLSAGGDVKRTELATKAFTAALVGFLFLFGALLLVQFFGSLFA